MLLESFQRDADLTELGSKMNRFFVRNALVARLVSEAAFKQYPQHVDVPIERPIFVDRAAPHRAPPCIHRLLTADPRHQGLELWLAEFPQPRPPRETWSREPGFPAARRPVQQGARGEPGLHRPALHDRRRGRGVLAAAAPVAAFGVLRDAGAHPHLLTVAGTAGLDQVVSAAPQNLQLIGLNDSEKRWVLKNPSHLFALDALFATYPDALVVQCHRPGGDHHGLDVLAGAAHDRGLVEQHSSAS